MQKIFFTQINYATIEVRIIVCVINMEKILIGE